MLGTLLTIAIVAVVLYPMYVLLDMSARRLIRRYTSEWKDNNDPQAVSLALSFLSTAKKSFYVFDDGDFDEDSTYHSSKFTAAAEKKMKADPDFKIRCFFNEGSEDLLFIEHFADSEFSRNGQIKLFRRKGEDRPNDYHCKIADNGVQGTLSEHLDERRRRFKTFSCVEMPWPDKLMAKKIIMKELSQDESLFERIGGGQS